MRVVYTGEGWGLSTIYSAGCRNNGLFLKVAFWLNRLSAGALNRLSIPRHPG